MIAASTLLALSLGATVARASDQPPVALAGQAFLAYPGERIILDGSASYDPEGYELSYAWTQVHGPVVQLDKADTAFPEWDAVVSGTYSFELVVNDGVQDSDADDVDVIVVDPSVGGDAQAQGGCGGGKSAGLVLLLPGLLALPRRRRS